MRIVSLVPHATELLFALGLGDEVVAVTHECDHAPLAAARPDLIVTQALCPVCAVSFQDVAGIAQELPSRPRVIALDPSTLGETQADVRTLAAATGRRERGAQLV